MSNTPRSDAATFNFAAAHPAAGISIDVVHVEFARQLERSNAELRLALQNALFALTAYSAELRGNIYDENSRVVIDARAALAGVAK